MAGDGGLQAADAEIAHPRRSPGLQRSLPARPVAAPADLAGKSKGVGRHQVHGRGLFEWQQALHLFEEGRIQRLRLVYDQIGLHK